MLIHPAGTCGRRWAADLPTRQCTQDGVLTLSEMLNKPAPSCPSCGALIYKQRSTQYLFQRPRPRTCCCFSCCTVAATVAGCGAAAVEVGRRKATNTATAIATCGIEGNSSSGLAIHPFTPSDVVHYKQHGQASPGTAATFKASGKTVHDPASSGRPQARSPHAPLQRRTSGCAWRPAPAWAARCPT